MEFEKFDKYCDLVIQQVLKMRDTKGREYANSDDRFDNFNRLSKRLDTSRLKVAYTYFTKHLDGIESYIKHGKTHSNERIEGRIVDAITYLLLIAGMIKEDEEDQEHNQKCVQSLFKKEDELFKAIDLKAFNNSAAFYGEELPEGQIITTVQRFCKCKGIAIPPHIVDCPVCHLPVNHPNTDF